MTRSDELQQKIVALIEEYGLELKDTVGVLEIIKNDTIHNARESYRNPPAADKEPLHAPGHSPVM